MTPLMVKGTLFGLLLLSAAVWDMRNREIPNLIPILLFLCGLIGFRPAASTAGLLLVGGPFLLAAVLIKRDGFAIGGGDVKLMAGIGLFLGWRRCLVSFMAAVLAGGIYGGFLILTGRKGRKDHFAFGPFLCAGAGLAAFFGNQILQWYLSVFSCSIP